MDPKGRVLAEAGCAKRHVCLRDALAAIGVCNPRCVADTNFLSRLRRDVMPSAPAEWADWTFAKSVGRYGSTRERRLAREPVPAKSRRAISGAICGPVHPRS